jgi:hypothetical protein
MRTKEFLVSEDTIVEFSELLEENNLKGTILGVSEDSEIKVQVTYERENRDVILDLMELVDGSEDDDDED